MTNTPGRAPVFHLSSPERAKRVAKALADELKARGASGFPYSRCQELVAQMYGHRTHQAMLADCGRYPASEDDAVAGEAAADARRLRHVAVLVDAGIPATAAGAVVDAIAPTRRADPRKLPSFERLPKEAVESVRGRRETLAWLRDLLRDCLPYGDADGSVDVGIAHSPIFLALTRVRPEAFHETAHELVAAGDYTGIDFTDMRAGFLSRLMQELSEREARGQGGRRERNELRRHIEDLAENPKGHPNNIEMDGSEYLMVVRILDAASLFDDVLDLLDDEGADAAGELAEEFADALDELGMRRYGPTNMAWQMLASRQECIPVITRFLPIDVPAEIEECAKEIPDFPERHEVDECLAEALSKTVDRGVARGFGPRGYFAPLPGELGYERQAGRVSAADAMVAAEKAGYGLTDIAYCAVAMAGYFVQTRPTGVDAEVERHWLAAIDRAWESSTTRELPSDLYYVAFAYMRPDFSRSPEAFFAALADAAGLQAAGVSPSDVAAAGMVAYLSTDQAMHLTALREARRRFDEDSHPTHRP